MGEFALMGRGFFSSSGYLTLLVGVVFWMHLSYDCLNDTPDLSLPDTHTWKCSRCWVKASIKWLSAGSLPVKCIINRRATTWMTRVLLGFGIIHSRLCVQSWWGWEWRQLCLVAYWLDLSCGQPACSLCSSNVHSSRPCIVTSCVQSTMPSIGCANCTQICLRVCCSTSKDFFWLLSSHSLRNFTDSASMQLQLEHLHIRVFHRYFHPPRVQCPPVVQCHLAFWDRVSTGCGQRSADN